MSYFDELLKKQREHDKKRQDVRNKAEKIVETFGFDSPEYRLCREEYESLNGNPLSAGEKRACRADYMTRYRCSSEFEMEEHVWPDEVEDFIGTLKKAGVKQFVYTDTGSGMPRTVYEFVKCGCTMGDACIVTRTGLDANGDVEITEHYGIRFTVN